LRAAYEIDLGPVGAFLPARVPLDVLPGPYQPFLDACAELPARYPVGRGGVRRWLDTEFGESRPAARSGLGGLTPAAQETLLTALSVLGHTYRWDTIPPAADRFADQDIRLPAGFGEVWQDLADRLGQPRVGTTWTLHLCNWRMTDRPGGAAYDPAELSPANLRVAHQWLGQPADRDLERFSLAFVLLEAAGARALRALVDAVDAAAAGDAPAVAAALVAAQAGIKAMSTSFTAGVRDSHIRPAVWLELVQPTFVWAAGPGDGSSNGPSGLQLATIQCLDALLGVGGNSELARAARPARQYLPPRHRHFLDAVDGVGTLLPDFARDSGDEALRLLVNHCLKWLRTFRTAHSARGARYLRAGRHGAQPRVSTGLGMHWRETPVEPATEPADSFVRSMAERIAETSAGLP
jgi:indoleamine 2,3-dioxygenase